MISSQRVTIIGLIPYTVHRKPFFIYTPQGGAIEGNAADDASMVDQARSFALTQVNAFVNE